METLRSQVKQLSEDYENEKKKNDELHKQGNYKYLNNFYFTWFTLFHKLLHYIMLLKMLYQKYQRDMNKMMKILISME